MTSGEQNEVPRRVDLHFGDADQEGKRFRQYQQHLTHQTTLQQIETEHRYLVDPSTYRGSQNEWRELAETWMKFRATIADTDEIWEFDTESVRGAYASGERGIAVLRNGNVVAYFITAIIG